MAEQTYKVTGMTCGHCATAVTNEVQSLDGVTNVQVNVDAGEVTVSSEHPLDASKVSEAINEAGYELVGSTHD